MCGKLTQILALVFVLSMVGAMESHAADAVAIWLFDDGAGDIAFDSTGNGHDGSLKNNPTWGDGKNGGGLWFSFVEANKVIAPVPHLNTLTIMMWAIYTDLPTTNIGLLHVQAGEDENADPGSKIIGMWVENTSLLWGRIIPPGAGNVNFPKNAMVEANVWNHFAMVIDADSGKATQYFNGEAVGEVDYPGELTEFTFANIGRQGDESWEGGIDEVALFDVALTEDVIKAAMSGVGGDYPLAFGPDPANGALHEDTWITLSWRAGDFAVSHDVYLGEDYQAVDEATTDSDLFRGNQVATFFVAGFPGFPYPDGLVPGTTYYWRIDEVNDADPNSPWKGDVWSFSIPPKTAYNPDPANGVEFVDPNNTTLSWTPGFGAILHTVYLGNDYDEVNNAAGGSPQGTATYSPGPLELEKVYYWRVDEFDAALTYKGDVWSFTTPGAVGNPQPAYGATDVGMNAILSWTPADSAASHQLYFGTDKEAVRTAGAGSPEYQGSNALGASSYDPGLLEADTTYYWRVDEVDDQGHTAKGPLWLFTTGAFLLVDDFEDFTDDDMAGVAIWQSWIDGFGVADNGAQVGYLVPPYCEQTIVHGGSQSMPFLYVNEGGVTNSEGSLTLTVLRDWTQAGVAELSLWFRGNSDNAAEPLYVAISNSGGALGIVAIADPLAAMVRSWTQWIIPLQSFADQGVNVTNIDKIAIGLGSKSGMASAGGSGTMFIDDIRLYRPR